jgi:hypothetical protein
VLGEDGISRPLDGPEAGAPGPYPAAAAAGDIQWLEDGVGAEALREFAATTGSFTAKLSWRACGPGRVLLGWAHPAFTADSRIFTSVAGDPRSSGSEHPADARVTVTGVSTQAGELVISALIAGHRPVHPHVDILVVNS